MESAWPDARRKFGRPDTMSDNLDRALDAMLGLAAERPWRDISLRDIAAASGVGFADLFTEAQSKGALLDALSRRFDGAALVAEIQPDDDPHDRLFEATMARVEAMEPHRAALVAIARAEGPLPLAGHFPRTARAILESAGLDSSGPRGAARIAALAAAWARIVQVWRDDEGALNRTMAEIDKLLKQMRDRLNRINAGF